MYLLITNKILCCLFYIQIQTVPQVSNRDYYTAKDVNVKISEINNGIYRIAGFVDTFGITFNQFLIDDEQPMLIHTGPIGMYKKIEEKVKEVIPLQKLAYVAFLHFESDEWGGMAFLDSANAKLVWSDLSSKSLAISL